MRDQSPHSRSLIDLAAVSLMWPNGRPPDKTVQSAWMQDLNLDGLVQAFRADSRYVPFIRQTLTALLTDPAVIAWRQAVLDDFRRNPALVERVSAFLPRFAELRTNQALFGTKQRHLLLETADRLSELELYVNMVDGLYEALQAADLHSEALKQLRQNLQRVARSESFEALRSELPELQRPLQSFASLTVGINLNAQLQPESAVLLGINEKRFGEARSFLSRLLGMPAEETEESGLAPLHYVPSDPEQRPLSALFRDLERLIAQVVQPVARALSRYVRISSGPLVSLEKELAFYVAAVGLMQRLEARGVSLCQPEIAPTEERLGVMEGLVNLHLALREGEPLPVSNDVTFDDEGRIAILTGPNSGGKTAYVQAVGLAHVLFQAGLFIPARRARLSPVDAIFTHFPALEAQQGRLAEEAARLRHICLKATRYSLVLLNESLSSTTSSEALYLAQDVLCGLRAIGVRAIYATHLVEVAEHLDVIEKAIEGDSAVYSLVAGLKLIETADDLKAVPTFEIKRGLPQGRSYAREIARRHGISLEQILAARREPHT
jgi:DNA mismatch repair ATPase MutS